MRNASLHDELIVIPAVDARGRDAIEIHDEHHARWILWRIARDDDGPYVLRRALMDAFGSPPECLTDEQLLDEVARRLLAGCLVVVRRALFPAHERGHELVEVPPVEVPPHTIEPHPKGIDDEERTWFEVRVVDEIGFSVAGLPVVVAAPGDDDRATDGGGVARVDGARVGIGHARIDDLAAARSILRPRWNEVRDGEWIAPAPDHTFVPLRELEGVEVRSSARRRTRSCSSPG